MHHKSATALAAKALKEIERDLKLRSTWAEKISIACRKPTVFA